ncbi:hypothetical protein KUCAC02_030373, partial [Chaenocephalus aceratus]
ITFTGKRMRGNLLLLRGHSADMLECNDLRVILEPRIKQGNLLKLVISIEGSAEKKPAGTSHSHRPNTSQALFDASVSKHGDPPTMLLHSTLMEGVQLSVADRHPKRRL